jgi:hypothetical protein
MKELMMIMTDRDSGRSPEIEFRKTLLIPETAGVWNRNWK